MFIPSSVTVHQQLQKMLEGDSRWLTTRLCFLINWKHTAMRTECDYRRVLVWYLDLLNSLIRRVTTLYTHTSVHSQVFTSRYSVAASNGGRSPFLWIPEMYPVSATSFSQQQLTTTEPQQLSHWLTNSFTHQPTQLNSVKLILANCPTYSISARSAQKTPFLCCCLRAVA
jgi:hypothetical protein